MSILFLLFCLNLANAEELESDNYYKNNIPDIQITLKTSMIVFEQTSYTSSISETFLIPSIRLNKRIGYFNEKNALYANIAADYLLIDLVNTNNNIVRYMFGFSGLYYINRSYHINYGFDYTFSKAETILDFHPYVSLDVNVSPYVSFDVGIEATLATGFYPVAGISFKK